MSIKLKVTLWYTLFMLALVFIFMFILISATASYTSNNLKKNLVDNVEEYADEIEYEKGKLDTEDLTFYENGVYIALYADDETTVLAGEHPTEISVNESFKDKDMRDVIYNGEIYYLYDYLSEFKKHDNIWVRGIVKGTVFQSEPLVYVALILLPLLSLLAAVSGYFIAKRAFMPVEKITSSASEISSGLDLTKRIDLGDGKDEIHVLAETVNSMLERLEDSFEREKEFTRDASHELRTPVSVILSESEFALDSDNMNEIHESLEVINRQALRMSKLIQSLLTMARADRNDIKLNIINLNLSELVRNVGKDFKTNNKSIKIIEDIESGIFMDADIDFMIRAVSNIVSNAVYYGKESGSIWLRLKGFDNHAELEIEDNGIGISKENIPHIWDKFFQVDKSRTNNTGIGLSMVKWIADIHGIDIDVVSELGRGTKFTLKIPFHHEK